MVLRLIETLDGSWAAPTDNGGFPVLGYDILLQQRVGGNTLVDVSNAQVLAVDPLFLPPNPLTH